MLIAAKALRPVAIFPVAFTLLPHPCMLLAAIALLLTWSGLSTSSSCRSSRSLRYKEAVELLLEVIRLAPNLADTYHTLGMTYDALGDTRKALDFYMIAGHLPPKDVDLWRRLAAMSTQQGFTRQAIYCLNKVLASDRTDLDSLWDKAVLLSEINMPRKVPVPPILQAEPRTPCAPALRTTQGCRSQWGCYGTPAAICVCLLFGLRSTE